MTKLLHHTRRPTQKGLVYIMVSVGIISSVSAIGYVLTILFHSSWHRNFLDLCVLLVIEDSRLLHDQHKMSMVAKILVTMRYSFPTTPKWSSNYIVGIPPTVLQIAVALSHLIV